MIYFNLLPVCKLPHVQISHKSLAFELVDDGRHPGTVQAGGHVPMIYTFQIFMVVDLHVWSSSVFEGGLGFPK